MTERRTELRAITLCRGGTDIGFVRVFVVFVDVGGGNQRLVVSILKELLVRAVSDHAASV